MLGNTMAASGWNPSSSVTHHSIDNVTRALQFCESCPKQILPFTIDLDPDLVCNDFLPPETKDNWDFPQCPEKCLLTDPVGQQQTQSGSVDIRVCSSSNNQ